MYDPILFTPEPSGILQPLDAQISQAIYTVAPEREAALKELIKRHRITIRIEKVSPGHEYGAIGSIGLAQFSLQGFERLWAYCAGASYAFMRQSGVKGYTPFAFTEDAAGLEVQKLLKWAFKADAKDDYRNNATWPSPAVAPGNHGDYEKLVRLTDNLFIGTIGFITLHEIGHIVRGHSPYDTLPRDENFRQEFEADEFAYDWMMDQWRTHSPDETVFISRSVSTASMLAIIAVLTMYGPTEVKLITHPNPIDRLVRFLLKHVNVDSKLDWKKAWGVSTLILQTHLSNVPDFKADQKWESGQSYLESIRPYFRKIEVAAPAADSSDETETPK